VPRALKPRRMRRQAEPGVHPARPLGALREPPEESPDSKTFQVSSGGHLPAETTGLDGKRYPAKRPTIVATKDERQA